MLSKVQYDYLKDTLVLKGVWDTIVKESPLIQRLPWKAVDNDIIQYNIETSMPTVSWSAVGDTIVENTGESAKRTVNIYKLIGDCDTDKGEIAKNPLQDPEATDITAKSKAMAHAVELAAILGRTSTSSNAKEPKGFLRILAEFESATTTDLDGISNSQVIPVHATSGALTMPYMDKLIDQIRPGKPDALLMSRLSRQKLNALVRASGTSGISPIELKEFGLFVEGYDNIPIFVSDWIPDNLPNNSSSVLTIATYDQSITRAADYDNTVIFAMKISEEDCTGLQVGNMTHERETFVENYDVIRNRFKWNLGFMCTKKYSMAALTGINPDS